MSLNASLFRRPLRLYPVVQHYVWGKVGKSADVCRLAGLQDEQQPCAELWMGAHPKAPAQVEIDRQRYRLDELISQFPKEILGQRVFAKFGATLPFLFKALSIRTALSIQAHPDLKLAAVLHQRDPKHYPDKNHKPEMAIAMGPVSLLYGFRSAKDVSAELNRTPELKELVGESETNFSVKELYIRLLHSPSDKIAAASRKLYQRLGAQKDNSPAEKWILRLQKDYPHGDVGLFSFFMLNFVELSEGEAVFVGPNVAHAYLEGEIIECMANSDNVVRAGLTEKFKDIETLSAMIADEIQPPQKIAAQGGSPEHQKFITPANEFLLERFRGNMQNEFPSGYEVGILLCRHGEATLRVEGISETLQAGSIYLIPAAAEPIQVVGKDCDLILARVP